MPTKRSQNKIVEREGVRYVQEVVENANCIYESVSLENDLGNDCYIEFITDNVATSFCVFAQIKSGESYKGKYHYKIRTDKEHLEYWHNHLNPIVGIVYDNDLKKAFWINITEYLKENPQVLDSKTHTIDVKLQCEFSNEKFDDFKNYFIDYIQEYKSYENFGRSLELFSDFDNPVFCYEGVKSLYSNHRDKKAAWFYLISNFGNIKEKGIQYSILGLLSNYTNNPAIFWHKDNLQYYPEKEMQKNISYFLSKHFKENEVKIAISFMGNSVIKGSFSFLIFLVLTLIEGIEEILLKLSFEDNIDIEERNFNFWLYIHFAQRKSVESTLNNIDEYLKVYPQNEEEYLFIGLKDNLINEGFMPIG